MIVENPTMRNQLEAAMRSLNPQPMMNRQANPNRSNPLMRKSSDALKSLSVKKSPM
jgi:hypothetical protein